MRDGWNSGRLECPGCGSSSFTPNPDGSLSCDYCHSAYVLSGHVCPECGAACDPDARHCPACGAELVRTCQACGALNPRSARRCMACGQELEMLEALFARVTGETADWLRQVREQAPTIKAQEELASQARLAEMRAVDARRREALARARAERDRQQRIIVTVTVAVVAVVIVVAVIAFAIAVSSTPSPCFYP
jgi:predicted amidophosphoribosyltransferase